MASFIDRCLARGDYNDDGGSVDIEVFKSFLNLIIEGSFATTKAHDYFSCTQAQMDEMDEIIATLPSQLSAKLRWVDVTYSNLMLGKLDIEGYRTNNEIRAHLGLPPV